MALRYKTLLFLAALLPSVLFCGCGDDAPSSGNHETPEDLHFKRTVIVYAAAANNLYGNLVDDKNEMLDGLHGVDLGDYNLLVYQTIPQHYENSAPAPRRSTLLQAVESKGTIGFREIKEYDADVFATDPARIREVIDDVREMSPSDAYGIIFWSHGTGWSPSLTDHEFITVSQSYGQDYANGVYDYTDIGELAEAIPDGMFDFIWFDCCYMAGIETLYELRDKADYMVAYPTEIMSEGMDYSESLPFIMKQQPNLVGAADAVFSVFERQNRPATVMIADMSALDETAALARRIYAGFTNAVPLKGLFNYARGRIGPFYDFGQYLRVMRDYNDVTISDDEIQAVLDRLVIFKAATAYDFSNRPIDTYTFSGISTHRYRAQPGQPEDYYRSLQWFSDTYPAYVPSDDLFRSEP